MAEEKKETPEVKEDAPASGGSGKLSAIVTIVNLLITLGIGAFLFLQFQKEKHKEDVSDISTEAAHGSEHGAPTGGEHGGGEAAGGHGAEGSGAKAPSTKVVTLEQFTVNLSTTVGTPSRFARVVIAVEIASEDTVQELNQKMPQVRNAIIDLFNSKRPSDLQTGEGRIFLKEEIKNALNSFLVTGKIKGVFFSNFAVTS